MLGLGILDTDITFEMSGRTDHLWLVTLFQQHGAQPLRVGVTEILMDLLEKCLVLSGEILYGFMWHVIF